MHKDPILVSNLRATHHLPHSTAADPPFQGALHARGLARESIVADILWDWRELRRIDSKNGYAVSDWKDTSLLF